MIVAIIAGVLVGWLAPGFGKAMEPIGTGFIALLRVLIGPIVFLTIISGIAGVADLRRVGLTGVKALAYFQVGTLLALAMATVDRGRPALPPDWAKTTRLEAEMAMRAEQRVDASYR